MYFRIGQCFDSLCVRTRLRDRTSQCKRYSTRIILYNNDDFIVSYCIVFSCFLRVLIINNNNYYSCLNNFRILGFRKGFVGHPYGFLSGGDFNIQIRLNMEDFSLQTTVAVDLSNFEKSLGGYSGGFVDGPWACFS